VTIDEVSKVVREVLTEFHGTMLNEIEAVHLTDYIVERLHLLKQMKEYEKQRLEWEKNKEMAGVK
jgi:hypothetical protein